MKKNDSRSKLEQEIYNEQQKLVPVMNAKKDELKNEFCKSNPVWKEKFEKIKATDYMWNRTVSYQNFQILDKPSRFIESNYAYRHKKSRFYDTVVEIEPYYDYEGCCYTQSVYLKKADAEAFETEKKKAIRRLNKINKLLEVFHNSAEYQKYLDDYGAIDRELYNAKNSIREKKLNEYNKLYVIEHELDDFTEEEFVEELRKHFPEFYIERETHGRSYMVRYLFHKRINSTSHSKAVAHTLKTTESCDSHYSREFLNKIIEQVETEINNSNSPANIIERMAAKYPTVYFYQKKTEVSAYLNVDENHYNSNYGHVGTMTYKKLDENTFDSIISKGIERVKNIAEKYSKKKELFGYEGVRQSVYKKFAVLNGWKF